MSIQRAWKDQIISMWKDKSAAFAYQITLEGEWDEVLWDYTDFGFTPMRKSKLTSRYVIPESFERFQETLVNVKRGAALLRFGNKMKKGGTRDFCLVGVAVAKDKGEIVGFDVYWRCSELVSQFLVDLLFLQQTLREAGFDPVGHKCRLIISYGYANRIFYPCFHVWGEKYSDFNSTEFIPWGEKILDRLDEGYASKYRMAERSNNSYRKWMGLEVTGYPKKERNKKDGKNK